MEKKDLKIGDIGEFGFIRSIQEGCHYSSKGIIEGIGDDCAVIGPYDGHVFLMTTDMLVEDIHFLLGKISPEDLGHKAMAVNLSDIAAMGGTPLHAVISIGIPKSMEITVIHAIYNGLKGICGQYGVNILGGDTSSSPENLIINVAVLGQAPEKEVLYRKGAKPGDRVYVTGTLGDSAGGLKLLRDEMKAPERTASILIREHNRPVPFLEAGRVIARSQLAGAMIDVSDGLIADLGHICEKSGVGARLARAAIPISDEVRLLAETNGLDPYELALYGGEDYRLLVTVPEGNAEAFEGLFHRGDPCHIHELGEITRKDGIQMIMENGSKKSLRVKGYDHFSQIFS